MVLVVYNDKIIVSIDTLLNLEYAYFRKSSTSISKEFKTILKHCCY